MAMDHNPQGRRGHFHRGRRGHERRGHERRDAQPPEQPNRERGDRVDVEQIMRDIRARIAQRSGVDLSNQQIQELAARRLDAILDPRGLKPGLLDQLRRSAGERPAAPETPQPAQPLALFDEATLYDSPSGFLRFIRRMLNPILRLFFNPTPVAHALAVQGRLNAELAAREAERDRRQSEWNALHYEIVQRLVTEVSRGSIEAQSLSLRVESLGAKVDFNERRVRSLEGSPVRVPRPQDTPPAPHADVVVAVASPEVAPRQPVSEGQPGDAPRRRRRRRRGRRGAGGIVVPQDTAAPVGNADVGDEEADTAEADEESDDEAVSADAGSAEAVAAETVMNREESAERQVSPEVPLDHRLPEPTSIRADAPIAITPPPDARDPTREG